MKFIFVIMLISLSACAGPEKVRVRNCKLITPKLYECDLVPEPSHDRPYESRKRF